MNYTSKAVYEYISEKTNDPIVEWKVCEVSGKVLKMNEEWMLGGVIVMLISFALKQNAMPKLTLDY